ncbi:MAG: hypothetical protein FWD87_06345 [Spirochaetaceae bacterium]|nr:hypothetical protein [Spirochaetaceae bacterium]
MNIQIPELDKIIQQNNLLLSVIQDLTIPEWVTLEDACKRKGVNINTARNSIFYQPRCGRADEHMHGRKVWHKTTILEWFSITDNNREQYIEKILGSEYVIKYYEREKKKAG